MGGLDRIPGQVPTHAAATQLAVPPPIPLLPQIAAQPPSEPRVQFLETRWHFHEAKIGVPPRDIPTHLTHYLPHGDPSRAVRETADFLLIRPPPRAVDCTLGGVN